MEIKDDSFFENEFKKLKSEDIIVGTERTLKLLKIGKIKEVFVASNCPEDIKKEIEHIAEIAGVKVYGSTMNSKNLGTLAKKPFKAVVVGVKSS